MFLEGHSEARLSSKAVAILRVAYFIQQLSKFLWTAVTLLVDKVKRAFQ
jgi:hypothetical protein